jgi:alkanesulfonate monooxygenase SsuD/methylene tetrahydromethanopterin reductase-like flavin-dependent oxidoreductase (luciferase family)
VSVSAAAVTIACVRVCLMIEGQEGVTWEQWLALADACERAGIEALFRSDHYTGFQGGEGGSLDAWATISALAAVTTTLRLGSLVSPATFRHPSVLARMAVTADHVSGGRVELGLGAGWHEPEHVQHGFAFPPARERVARFAEQLEIVHRSWTEAEFDFHGRYYDLVGAHPLPKPLAKPNLIVGGSAKPGTAVPAARFADEYNTIFASPDEAARRRGIVSDACDQAGRPMLTFSLMTQCILGADRDDVERRRRRVAERTGSEPERRSDTTLVGTLDEVRARLREYEDAGVERVMAQHLLHDDLEMVELLGAL